MKRLIGLIGIASVFAISCMVLESRAATFENVSETSEITYTDLGFGFDLVAVITPEILLVRDKCRIYL
jgi:hypothetical protein